MIFDNCLVKIGMPMRTAENIREDLRLLEMGILDPQSFHNGYESKPNPIEWVHKNKDGKVLAIRRMHNLRTDYGTNALATAIFGGIGVNPVKWMAITADNSVVPLVGDTSLIAEYTTSGLGRQGCGITYAVAATPSSAITDVCVTTLTATYTSPTAGNVVNKIGVFDNPTLGASPDNLWYEAQGPYPVTLNVQDTLTVVYKIQQ